MHPFIFENEKFLFKSDNKKLLGAPAQTGQQYSMQGLMVGL